MMCTTKINDCVARGIAVIGGGPAGMIAAAAAAEAVVIHAAACTAANYLKSIGRYQAGQNDDHRQTQC